MGTISEIWVEWNEGDREMSRWTSADLEREMLDLNEEPHRVIHIYRETGDAADRVEILTFDLRQLQRDTMADAWQMKPRFGT